jgi:hypothetical protein
MEVLLAETKRILEYVQEMDPSAKFISRSVDKDNKPFPALESPTDKHWPKKFGSVQHWFQIPAGYLYSEPPISEKQLQARIETRRNRNRMDDSANKRRKTKKSAEKVDRGATTMYVTINLYTTILKIKTVLESMNVDFRRHNVRVTLKQLQC